MFSQITVTNLSKSNAWTTPDTVAETSLSVSAIDETLYGGFFHMTDKDSRYLIKVTNTHGTNSATVSVEPGEAQWAGVKPTVTLAAGKSVFIQVESGRHKFLTENADMLQHCAAAASAKGAVFITGTAPALKVTVYHTVL